MDDNAAVDYEAQARKIGWLPEDQFKGDKSKWVDAETFVRRGEEFLPFIKAENRKLQETVSRQTNELSELKTLLKSTKETVDALKEYNSEMNRERAKEKSAEIVQSIKAAREEGDIEAEEKLREQLAETREALKESAEKKIQPAVSANEQVKPPPEWDSWVAENPWWNEDEVMRAAATAISAQLAARGDFNNLTIAERFKLVAEKVRQKFKMDTEEPRRTSKVEPSKGGGGAGASGGKGYKDLPSEVRQACDRFADRLVGKDKTYKTVDEWRKKYASDYFAE